MSGTESVGLPLAFLAGLLSFLSPCVLPLIPSYVSFITGLSLEDAGQRRWVALGHLPPSLPLNTRYLVKRLHAALPDVRILVGRWGPLSLADESTQGLRDAGANLVASTLTETRMYLGGLVDIPRIPAPGTSATSAS